MRRLAGSIVSVVVGVGLTAGVAWPMGPARGRLVGVTEISFGCPGPARIGKPVCDPWRLFPGARFSLTRVGASNSAGLTVTSDTTGHFSIRLGAGRYTITPLAQAHTRGGLALVVRIRNSEVSSARVRFVGFPRLE